MIYTFIDTETTGLDLFEHEVIDIALLQVQNYSGSWTEITRFQSRIEPVAIEKASPVALKINGYNKRKWDGAPKPYAFLPLIKSIVETSDVVVGQNLVFDYRFINKMFEVNNYHKPNWPEYIDTKFMADQLVHDKKLKRSSLDFLCEHYQIPTIGRAHTALTDVLRTFELFKILINTTEVAHLSFVKPYDPYGDKNAI